MTQAAALAWRNRGLAAGLVGAGLVGARLAVPDADARAELLYFAVMTLGYGHLIGGALFARHRMRAWVPRGVSLGLAGLFGASCVATAFVLFVNADAIWPAVVPPLLGLSVWHAVENDLVLRDTYARSFRCGPLPSRASHHVVSALLSAAVVAVFASSQGPNGPLSPWVSPAEVFAAFTLYHVLSWLVLSLDRARSEARRDAREGRRLLTGLLAVHAVPAFGCVALLAAPIGGEHPLRVLVFAPALYLFWASLHVVQTLAVRGLVGK